MGDIQKLIKDWKMATVWGIIFWVLIFVVITVMMFGFPNLYQSWCSLITNPFLVVFCAWMYFKSVKGKLKDGIVLGIYWIILGTVLDLLITIPLFVKDYGFFTEWMLWLSWVELVFFAAITPEYLLKK